MVRNDGTAPYRSALQHRIRPRGSNPSLLSLTTHTPSQPIRKKEKRTVFRWELRPLNSATLRHVPKRNCERQRADRFHGLWILCKKATDLIHY